MEERRIMLGDEMGGVVSADTLLLMHFDSSDKDECGHSTSFGGVFFYNTGKFENCIRASSQGFYLNTDLVIDLSKDFTIEMFIYNSYITDVATSGFGVYVSGYNDNNLQWFINYAGDYPNRFGIWWASPYGMTATKYDKNLTQFMTSSKWMHVAMVYSISEDYIEFYIDGKAIGYKQPIMIPDSSKAPSGPFYIHANEPWMIDELRVSSIVRYKSDFTPPEKPFS